MNNSRYEGKPFLRLLELWVLWVINEIDPHDLTRLTEMEPGLRRAWSLEGRWNEMIEKQLDLSPEIQEDLRKQWEHNRELARVNGIPAPSQMFAQSIADQIAAIR